MDPHFQFSLDLGLLAPTTSTARHPAVASDCKTQVQKHKFKSTTWALNTPTLQVHKDGKNRPAGSF